MTDTPYLPITERMKHPLPDGPHWYAVMTAPRKEFDVAKGLKRIGYWPYCPFVRVRKTVRRPHSTVPKVVTEETAYFARYVFIGFRFRDDNWDDVRMLAGVSSPVKARLSGIPLRLPDAVMEQLMAKDSGGLEPVQFIDLVGKGPRAKLPPGTIIEWQPGSYLQDRIAEVISDKGGDSIEVEMDGRKVKVRTEHVKLGEAA